METSLQKKTGLKPQKPKQYCLIFYNDDYTSMSFVTEILVRFCDQSLETARALTLEIHTKGMARVGSYTHEIAEMKQYEIMRFATVAGYPFLVEVIEI